MPLVRTQPPRNTWDLAMWPSGFGRGAARENPAASPAVLAGEGARKVLGVVRDRLVCGFGADRSPVSFHGGTGRRWPRAAFFR
jgi:hypothetical protein